MAAAVSLSNDLEHKENPEMEVEGKLKLPDPVTRTELVLNPGFLTVTRSTDHSTDPAFSLLSFLFSFFFFFFTSSGERKEREVERVSVSANVSFPLLFDPYAIYRNTD